MGHLHIAIYIAKP